MAKSQYTDSITGDVILDTRVINSKIYNVASKVNRIINYNVLYPNEISFVAGKYSTNCVRIGNNKAANQQKGNQIGFYSSAMSNVYTISFWSKCLTFPSSISSSETSKGIYNMLWFNAINTSGSHILDGNVKLYALWKYGSGIKRNYHEIQISQSNINNYSDNLLETPETWYHYAITVNNGTIKVYRNGVQTLTSTSNYLKQQPGQLYNWFALGNQNDTKEAVNLWIQFDDFVVIDKQVLWTSNFTVPNYLLTGDHELPKKIKRKSVMHPALNYRGDYFDKAIIY